MWQQKTASLQLSTVLTPNFTEIVKNKGQTNQAKLQS
jgi:hypothetical protein